MLGFICTVSLERHPSVLPASPHGASCEAEDTARTSKDCLGARRQGREKQGEVRGIRGKMAAPGGTGGNLVTPCAAQLINQSEVLFLHSLIP